LGIDPVLVLGHQPVGAIERPAGFLATGQGQFQRPPKLGSSLFQTNERIREDRSLRLVVGRAATFAVESPVDACAPIDAIMHHY